MVTTYRIIQLWVEGMRSLDGVELDLSAGLNTGEAAALAVLIGPNGAGKSTIIEACELLRKIGAERPFVGTLYDTHGGPPGLVRKNGNRLGFGVQLRSSDGVDLKYVLLLRIVGVSLTIDYELAVIREPGNKVRSLFSRSQRYYETGSWVDRIDPDDSSLRSLIVGARRYLEASRSMAGKPVEHDDLALQVAAHEVPELKDLQAALSSIEVHTAIDARAPWTVGGGDPGPRASNIIRPVTRVEQGGRNLPNVYHALRNQQDWPQTLERIRLALGEQIEDVLTPADPSGGRIGLALRISGLGEVPAFSISDGQLSYLALLGVLRLQRPSPPALVAIDEPDLHLHPSLARRLMADLETFARSTPVLVATQSDAMLDALSDPAQTSVLCELDERHATQLVRPDRESLQRWLGDYRGLGELRAAGYEGVVFPTLETP